jgi:hypothetical protein
MKCYSQLKHIYLWCVGALGIFALGIKPKVVGHICGWGVASIPPWPEGETPKFIETPYLCFQAVVDEFI